jgi:hypothetical protein
MKNAQRFPDKVAYSTKDTKNLYRFSGPIVDIMLWRWLDAHRSQWWDWEVVPLLLEWKEINCAGLASALGKLDDF